MTATERSLQLATAAAKAAADKLAESVQGIDVSDQLALTDIFVIVVAGSERQIGAIVDAVEDDLRDLGAKPVRREGDREARWVLIDFGDIVVHVQHEEEAARPAAAIAFDCDPVQARATREAILAQAASENLLIAGMHLGGSGLAHIVPTSHGYRIQYSAP